MQDPTRPHFLFRFVEELFIRQSTDARAPKDSIVTRILTHTHTRVLNNTPRVLRVCILASRMYFGYCDDTSYIFSTLVTDTTRVVCIAVGVL